MKRFERVRAWASRRASKGLIEFHHYGGEGRGEAIGTSFGSRRAEGPLELRRELPLESQDHEGLRYGKAGAVTGQLPALLIHVDQCLMELQDVQGTQNDRSFLYMRYSN